MSIKLFYEPSLSRLGINPDLHLSGIVSQTVMCLIQAYART